MTSPPVNQSGTSPPLRSGNKHVRLTGVALAVVVFGALGLAWWLGFSSREELAPVIARPNLALQQGRLYQISQTQPFTGMMVELHPDGLLRSRSAISNGLLHGVSEGWHPNQQLAVRENFRAGISHGMRTKWYENGVKVSEAMIVDGKLHGTFRRWHENGGLAEEIEMRNGSPDGLSRAYYASGYLKAQAQLQNGKLVEQKSWKDGEFKAGHGTISQAN